MSTLQRISLSLPTDLINFLKNYSKSKQASQSAVVSDALQILKVKKEAEELQQAYLKESMIEDDFAELASNVFLNDFIQDGKN